MEETLKLILTKLTSLEEGQKALLGRQAAMEKRQEALEERQISMEERQASLEQRQISMEKRQASLEQLQISMEKRQASLEQLQISMEKRQASLEDGQKSLMQGQHEIRLELDRRITESENMILNELDRVQERFDTKFTRIEKNLEEIQQYYRINRLENDNTTLLLKLHDDIQKRVAELERKTA